MKFLRIFETDCCCIKKTYFCHPHARNVDIAYIELLKNGAFWISIKWYVEKRWFARSQGLDDNRTTERRLNKTFKNLIRRKTCGPVVIDETTRNRWRRYKEVQQRAAWYDGTSVNNELNYGPNHNLMIRHHMMRTKWNRYGIAKEWESLGLGED